jgi:hypothetical protein
VNEWRSSQLAKRCILPPSSLQTLRQHISSHVFPPARRRLPNAYLTAYINRPVPLLLFANSTNIQHLHLCRKDSANIPFTLYYPNSTEEESSAT